MDDRKKSDKSKATSSSRRMINLSGVRLRSSEKNLKVLTLTDYAQGITVQEIGNIQCSGILLAVFLLVKISGERNVNNFVKTRTKLTFVYNITNAQNYDEG